MAACIFAYAAVCAAGEIKTENPTQVTLANNIDAVIAPRYRPGEPGAVLLVIKDGHVLFRKAYGEADVLTHTPLSPDMAMPIGSMTKQFTAVAVMLLAESGKLSVGDPITRYLPTYPTHGKTITIENLLTHTSGIPDYVTTPDWPSNMGHEVSTQGLLDTISQRPLDFEPGAKYDYSSSNYVLLGAIIEKVSGLPYAKFLEQRIFLPLGMKDTGYARRLRGNAALAAGHTLVESGFIHSPPVSPSQLSAAGGMLSTVDDLARWNKAIDAGRLLSAAGWKKVFTPYRPREGTSEYGYGFQIGDSWQSTMTIRHGGRVPGFESFAMRLPEQQMYVAVLSNLDGGRTPPYEVAQRAALVTMGKALPAAPSITLDNNVFDAYVGRYQMTGLPMVVDLRRAGDQYLASVTGQETFALKALSETRFLAESAGAELQFEKNADGVIDRFVLLQGPRRITAIRIAQPD
ncbi:serine hydrolase domain-containing protein [Duganella radicis]|nr:serine hydrolase domain-containing protein [Duganella radicis]